MNLKTINLIAAALSGMTALAAFETPQEAIEASKIALQKKNFQEAHKNLNEGLKLSVNPTERILVLNRHGELYKMQKDWKNAEKMIMMIIDDKKATNDQKAEAWNTIARYKDAQRKYEDAIEAYQKSLELRPTGNQAQEVMNKCGMLLVRIKDFTSAIECFKQVPTIPCKDKRRATAIAFQSYLNIANAYVAMKQHKNAIQQLNDMAKKPEFKSARQQAEIQKAIFKIYDTQIREAVRLKRFDEAQKGMDEVKKIVNDNRIISLQIYLLSGKAAFAARKRDYQKAEEYYNTAIKIATPAMKFGAYGELIQYGLIHRKYDKAEKAVKELQALPCTKVDDKYQISFWTFRYLNVTKKYNDAIKVMEETAKIKGLPPYRLANCYGLICGVYFNGLKNKEKAIEYYKKATAVPRGNWKNAYLKKKLGL